MQGRSELQEMPTRTTSCAQENGAADQRPTLGRRHDSRILCSCPSSTGGRVSVVPTRLMSSGPQGSQLVTADERTYDGTANLQFNNHLMHGRVGRIGIRFAFRRTAAKHKAGGGESKQ